MSLPALRWAPGAKVDKAVLRADARDRFVAGVRDGQRSANETVAGPPTASS